MTLVVTKGLPLQLTQAGDTAVQIAMVLQYTLVEVNPLARALLYNLTKPLVKFQQKLAYLSNS